MPRVKQVVAAKDYPNFGIKKGQKHYHWKRKTGPRSSKEYRQVEPPRIEQLTGSSYRIAMHYIEKAQGEISSVDDMDGLIQMVEELASEQREKFDNMPEGLQQGDTGQRLEEQADALDAAVSELEEIKSEWESALSDYQTALSEYEIAKGEFEEAEADWDAWNESDQSEDEPDLPDEPEEPEDPHNEYVERVQQVSFD